MRRLIFFISCLLFVVSGAASAEISEEALKHISGITESILDFSSEIRVTPNSRVFVVEKITYDFETTPNKHGIYRLIPYTYSRNGTSYNLRVQVTRVWNPETGTDYQYTTRRTGGNIEVKIGDSDETVSGVNVYQIAYEVDRAINYFDDHDELYWNVTGNEWQVAIAEARAVVTVEGLRSEEGVTSTCFTGRLGSTEKDCTATTSSDNLSELQANADFSTTTDLRAENGLTLVLGIPKGTLTENSLSQNVLWFIQDNWIFGLPIVLWIFLHIFWLRKGRDPKLQQAVIPEYEAPEGLRPGEVGTLWDEKAETKDISATLIDLAVRGFIKIRALEKNNYEFIRLQKDVTGLQMFEKELLDAIFLHTPTLTKVELKTLKNKLYKDLPGIQKHLYTSCVTRGYFNANPNTIRNGFRTVAGICAVLPFFMLGMIQDIRVLPICIVMAILLALYGQFMPKRTHAGVKAKVHIKGFKWFLSVTEKERLKFHNAPAKKPELFEQFLPYAMVLGVENEWAGQFADIYKGQPGWYEGPSGSVFNAVVFAHAMSSMSSNVGSTFTSHPTSAGGGSSGFGGGGFSGGGFGGGGGGSW